MGMELATTGRVYYANYKMKMQVIEEELLLTDTGYGERYRFILLQEGCGILRLGTARCIVQAPAICCLDVTEKLVFEEQSNLKASALYFHPCVVNNKLQFEYLQKDPQSLTISDTQDQWQLRPFIIRNERFNGVMPIEGFVFKKIAILLSSIGEQLEDQTDTGWPCRSRSYLFELLFLISKLYENQHSMDMPLLQETDTTIQKVILYLHTQYQNKITIEQLIDVFHINKTTLNENFRKATGLSIIAYLNNLRIRIACSLLKNTLRPISDILFCVGFQDSSHFGRIFQKNMRCSPTEYRQQHCWML